MKTLFRTIGSLIYTGLINAGLGYCLCYILVFSLKYADSFWKYALIDMGLMFGGPLLVGLLKFVLIPYYWLWNNHIITRLACAIPSLLVGIWIICAPWRIPWTFSIGDWITTILWIILCIGFYYTIVLLPMTFTEQEEE